MTELKPCPFCGKEVTPITVGRDTGNEYRFEDMENEVLDYFKCYECCAEFFFDTPYSDEDTVNYNKDKIDSWNRRDGEQE